MLKSVPELLIYCVLNFKYMYNHNFQVADCSSEVQHQVGFFCCTDLICVEERQLLIAIDYIKLILKLFTSVKFGSSLSLLSSLDLMNFFPLSQINVNKINSATLKNYQ